jgi:hypothetical protein
MGGDLRECQFHVTYRVPGSWNSWTPRG